LFLDEGGADALFNSLDKSLEEDGIGWEKVIGYVSDGEHLMRGQNNSVLIRIKNAVPDIYVLKYFCHSFHLVVSYSCECLSKTAELVHYTYNFFKNLPNRQRSYEEFLHFVQCQPHTILKPCQTLWFSLSQCVSRILEQWPALQQFFISEAMETKSPQAERILQSLRSLYVKATLEFMDLVLGHLTGSNAMFRSESFQLHRFLPDVVKIFCRNFMLSAENDLQSIEVDDEGKWRPLEMVYPGIIASESLK